MKIILTLFLSFILAACGTTPAPDATEQSTETTAYEESAEISTQTPSEPDAADTEIYPVVIYRHDAHYGYIIGGVVNHNFISLDENLDQLSQNADCTYSFFTDENETLDITCESAETIHVDATGTDEIVVKFKGEEMKHSSVGIGNLRQPLEYTESITIDTAGTFEIDFDGDGKIEKLVILNDNSNISVSLENQEGITELTNFTIDEIYTTSFVIYASDITQNGNKELLICLDGHDYSTGVFAITSTNSKKISAYYMGN